jgi:glyoxylase-like metal-dependent hydrolase (beta-lactamase superfamily II)
MRAVLPGIHSWSVFSEEKRLDFNGFLLVSPGGNVLIDPPRLDPQGEESLRRLGLPAVILLTNKDHRRSAPELRERYSARLGIHELDAPLLGIRPDFTFRDGEMLPGGARTVRVPDNKTPGETVFLLEREGGIAVLGDALIGRPDGGLSLLPPEKYADPVRAREGIRRLLEHPFRRILIGDGPLLPVRDRSALVRFLESA